MSSTSTDLHSLTRLSPTVFRICEKDPFGENPFIYLILGDGACSVIVDTGCGCGNLLAAIREHFAAHWSDLLFKLNNITVVNTHNHYDHVGGNSLLQNDPAVKVGFVYWHCFVLLVHCSLFALQNICASSANKKYTTDYFATLSWYAGSNLQKYSVTRWLDDLDHICLSDDQSTNNQSTNNHLTVIHTPGHTPDSLCLYYAKEDCVVCG